jgi:Arc/MetJ-type ribon-helix-helix transcriptional regulator
MQEIIELAQLAGLGPDPESIVRTALEDWWSERLAESIGPDELQHALNEAAEDTSAGMPAEEVFARLRKEFAVREGADAA